VTATLAAPWPALREEIQLLEGPTLPDGQPSWTLHDPVRHRFLRIDWRTFEVLRRWWLASPEAIAAQVSRQTTLSLAPDDVEAVRGFLQANELTLREAPREAPAPAWWAWLLHHYLFFRVPLVNPDAWLQRWLPRVRWLGDTGFLRATLAALALGALLVARDVDAFVAQAVDLLSWRGLALYGATLCGVKLLHECGHAFTARHHGCRVPTMGVAFMVMWPVAYTDTTEAWKLRDARARLQIALAGVRTEMAIAAWATLAWAVLPDGSLRTAAFILATLTWVTTLAVNLSPFMRFDGYFVLCDALDEPNLHERSFALARHALRRVLLGWDGEPPELLPAGRRHAMVVFAVATWAYRLALYLGIAWMVYAFAIKAVGLVLFVVEMAVFIVGPVWRELRAWHAARAAWRGGARARRWLWLAPLLVALGFVPLPSHDSAGAVLQPAAHLALRLPATAVLTAVHVRPGQHVAAGAPLLEADAPALRQRVDAARARIRQLQTQVAAAGVDVQQQARWGSLQQALATARDELRAAEQEQSRLRPVAPFAGRVLDVDSGAQPGAVAGTQQVLLQLAAPQRWRIVAYAGERSAQGLKPGDTARFIADARPLQTIAARVLSVAPHPSAWLQEPVLAQVHGGAVEATAQSGRWQIATTLYRVELEPLEAPTLSPRQWRGHAVLAAPARGVWQRLATEAGAVLTREFGF
jgi:putative peptide zinc metalloprotease protein